MILMKFYLSGLGNMYHDLTHISEAIIEADKLGFSGALMPDHYMWGARGGMHMMKNPYSTLETWTTLTYLAAKTEQISLGTLVTPIPFRPPGILAKMLSTLDVLSEGRAVLGVGAGWSKVEFDGYSIWNGPGVRVSKTQEGLDLMIKLWTEDKVTFKGKYYEAEAAVLEPKPVQKPYPKLLFGGTGKRMLRMAGKYGDICYIPMWGGNPEENWKIVLNAAEKAGRRDKLAIMMGDMGAMRSKNSEGHIASIEAAVEKGAEYYMVAFQRGEGYIDSMKKFASEVMVSFP